MEKLIELLNKYETKTVVHWYEWYWQDVLMCRYIKDNFEFYTDEATTIVISKYYWFIKWLVENDKIDLDMVREKLWIPCCVWYGRWRIIAVKDVEDYKQILMLLSISDTPIDDLVSYLK